MIEFEQLQRTADVVGESSEGSGPSLPEIKSRARVIRRRRSGRLAGSTALLAVVAAVLAVPVLQSVTSSGPQTSANLPDRHPLVREGSVAFVGAATVAYQAPSGLMYLADESSDSLLVVNPNGSPAFNLVSTIKL